MESEALDRRMAKEATIGLVVLVALVGILFLTIWLKARAIWAEADEDLLTTPVNVFSIDHGNVLVPIKKPSQVPLPEVESNQIVDLGEMRPISAERLAEMFPTGSESPIRIAVADSGTSLPGMSTPALPNPLPDLPLLAPESSTPEISGPGLPVSPQVTPIPPANLSPLPPSNLDRGLPQLPLTPDSSNNLQPADYSLPGATTSVAMARPTAAEEALVEDQAENESPAPSMPSGPTAIVLPPPSLPSLEIPSSNSTAIPTLAEATESSSITQSVEQGRANAPTPVPLSTIDPLNDALHRAAMGAQAKELATFEPTPSEAELPKPVVAPRSVLEPPASVTTISVTENPPAIDSHSADDHSADDHSPSSYSADELKAAMRRLSLPNGMTMKELSRRLYGSPRYARALHQLNHRRADDRGRFLPGTQIAYLPGPMLAFVYPDLIESTKGVEQPGSIRTVQFQENSPTEADTPLELGAGQSNAPSPSTPSEKASSIEVPEWVVTEGGESLFQLAVDHYDQASYYLNLYQWNRSTMEGRYRPTDPLPKGLQIRLHPPTR